MFRHPSWTTAPFWIVPLLFLLCWIPSWKTSKEYFQAPIGGTTTSKTTLATTNASATASLDGTNSTHACKHSCLSLRGMHGRWVQDWDYAKKAQYPRYGSYPPSVFAQKRFRPSPEAPFRWPTSFRWQDDHCPVELIEPRRFCEICKSLNIARIYVLGDSLSGYWSASFLSLMGRSRVATVVDMKEIQDLACPNDWTVQHLNYRWTGKTVNATLSDPLPSSLDFASNHTHRTLWIVNTGVHLHSVPDYQIALDALLEFLQNQQRPDDIYMFRNTAPGHTSCQPRQHPKGYNWSIPIVEYPFENYSEWKQSNTNRAYDWDLVEAYNDYAQQQIQHVEGLPYLYLMNVFNMTILRKDGHAGGNDCLHYSLPGPPDWWVHLMYTNLKELAECLVDSEP